jgi:hypothetical protein
MLTTKNISDVITPAIAFFFGAWAVARLLSLAGNRPVLPDASAV